MLKWISSYSIIGYSSVTRPVYWNAKIENKESLNVDFNLV
jgi:hypothetical protein